MKVYKYFQQSVKHKVCIFFLLIMSVSVHEQTVTQGNSVIE